MVKRIPLTIKIACFKQDECAEDKCVETVGGISSVIGCRLKKAGVNTADQLRANTKGMRKCEFVDYMKCVANSNVRYAGMAYKSLYGKVTECAVKHKLEETCAKCRN